MHNAAPHTTDTDCAPFLPPDDGTEEQVCTGCGVAHGDPCLDCGGRGFHLPVCPSLRPVLTTEHINLADHTVRCPICGAESEWETWRDSDERGHFTDGQLVTAACDCIDQFADVLVGVIGDARDEDNRWGGDADGGEYC